MRAVFKSSPLCKGLIHRLHFTPARRMMHRDYRAAIAALNSLQSNFAVVEAVRKSRQAMNEKAIPEMIGWLRRIDYEPSELDHLNIIHIAGTKGKGSTSAFISSILCQYIGQPMRSGTPLRKIGLYTSPHLRSVRERIRINHAPLTEEVFAKYFFEVWDRLEAYAISNSLPADGTAKPMYFRYLTLMAFHVYIRERVDAAIIECGVGGEYDSTNILKRPIITGIASLGIDHTAILGNTIEDIAWHKAGIMKPGVPSFTAPQPEAAMKVLQDRAKSKGSQLTIVGTHAELENSSIKLGLAGEFQKINGSLAISITDKYLQSLGIIHTASSESNPSRNEPLPPQFRRGLEQVTWGGRCETRHEDHITWYIDGGHTLESIKLVAEWYATQINRAPSPEKCILFFNQQTRDASALAHALHQALFGALSKDRQLTTPIFTHAIFTTNITFDKTSSGHNPDLVFKNVNEADIESLAVQKALASTWAEIDQSSETHVKASIQEGIREVRRIARDNDRNNRIAVLVTGSLHLVGGVLEILETSKK